MRVKVAFLDPDDRVLPDLSARVNFTSAPTQGHEAKSRVVVPKAALTTVDGRSGVFRVVDGRAVFTPVTPGGDVQGQVEITQGLQGGETSHLARRRSSDPGRRKGPRGRTGELSMAEPLIRIDHVEKIYRRDQIEVPVLLGVNLEIPEGEYVALMGPSGSGKTTLLNLIAGIDSPTRGRIVIGGRDIATLGQTELARWRSTTIGFIFQLYNLLPVLTAFENVELPLLLTHLKKAERRKHVETALSIVSLADRMDHYPRQLSGGQEQRVAIARAIVSDPKILVADEPTGDLDAKSGDEILDLLRRLNEEFGKTIVMVTHDPKAASRAHRMIHLDKGVLHADERTGSMRSV